MRETSVKMLLASCLIFMAIQICEAEPSANPETLTVSLCELVSHPDRYSGKRVKLDADLLSGEEFAILADDSCPSFTNQATGKVDDVEAVFDQARYNFKSHNDKKLGKLLRKDNQAKVVVVGEFVDPGHYIGHALCCRYQLRIDELLSVEKITRPKSVKPRIPQSYYVMSRSCTDPNRSNKG